MVEARRRWHVRPRVLCLAFVAALGCDASERSPAVGSAGTFPASAGAAGHLPAGGQGGAGASSDASTNPIDAVGGGAPSDAGGIADAGSGPDTVDGSPSDAGNEEPAPAVWSCDGDYAFGAGSTLLFIDPTPPGLASALTELTELTGATHPISLVLHLEEGALIGALSPTTEDDSGQHAFFPDDVPSFAPVVLAFGSPPGVTSVDPQAYAALRFEDQSGPVDIEIEHVVWRATQGASCADMTVSLQAVLPESQLSVLLHLSTGEQTIGELISSSSSGSEPRVTPIGGPDPAPTQVEIAATFKGVPLDFAFEGL